MVWLEDKELGKCAEAVYRSIDTIEKYGENKIPMSKYNPPKYQGCR
ncbi:MAG: hypothetical protein AABY14_00975 [Nanoarchaeota archaeon]